MIRPLGVFIAPGLSLLGLSENREGNRYFLERLNNQEFKLLFSIQIEEYIAFTSLLLHMHTFFSYTENPGS